MAEQGLHISRIPFQQVLLSPRFPPTSILLNVSGLEVRLNPVCLADWRNLDSNTTLTNVFGPMFSPLASNGSIEKTVGAFALFVYLILGGNNQDARSKAKWKPLGKLSKEANDILKIALFEIIILNAYHLQTN
ncbi:MAG: hypothetical protein N2035_04420 [Chthoniobacterales bacterium]|nr:hypothetical protein [Chthoniobacterales bacterium]